MLYFACRWGWALFRFYDDPVRYFGQIATAMGIAVGGIVGAGAAIQTGDLFRYLETAVYVGITAPLYILKFFVAKRSSS